LAQIIRCRDSEPEGGQEVTAFLMRLHGHVHPEFWPVARALARQLRRGGRGGAAVCVYHRGECVDYHNHDPLSLPQS